MQEIVVLCIAYAAICIPGTCTLTFVIYKRCQVLETQIRQNVLPIGRKFKCAEFKHAQREQQLKSERYLTSVTHISILCLYYAYYAYIMPIMEVAVFLIYCLLFTKLKNYQRFEQLSILVEQATFQNQCLFQQTADIFVMLQS